MKNVIASMDEISEVLEDEGHLKLAYQMDMYANTLERIANIPDTLQGGFKVPLFNNIQESHANLKKLVLDIRNLLSKIDEGTISRDIERRVYKEKYTKLNRHFKSILDMINSGAPGVVSLIKEMVGDKIEVVKTERPDMPSRVENIK